MTRRKILVIGSLLTVVGGVVLALVATGPAFSAPSTGPSRPFSGPADPAFIACQATAKVCDPAADAAARAANPPAQPPSTNARYLSRADVEARARAGAQTPLTPAANPGAPVFSALLSRAALEALTGQAANAAVDARRLVWVVTVHAPMATDGSPSRAPQIFPVYSVALDAETGQWTDACIGCAWLDKSR